MSVTLLLVGLTCLISYNAFQNRQMFNQLKHFPYVEARQKEYFRFISSGFIHANWGHLLVNMFVLWNFGEIVERYFTLFYGNVMGPVVYILVYIFTILVASIPSYLKHKENPYYSAIGASGAVSGIVFIFILFHPWEKLTFLFFPFIGFPAILLGVAYLVYSSWASRNSNDNIGHDAHLYGGLCGFIIMILLKPELVEVFFTQIMAGLPI